MRHSRLAFTLIDPRLREDDMAVQSKAKKSGFTLIELLVVIAIIAILAIVVVLTLNPAQLLQQSRDSDRLSDLANIQTAVNLFATDQPSGSLGLASTTYVSIPDPTATTTAGDQCQGLGLPALPSGWAYHCAASSSYRNINGTGWIPVNLSTISSGSPLSLLPQDPISQTSTNLYYTYTTNGSQYEVAGVLESSKYKSQLAINPQVPMYPEVAAEGSNLALSTLWNPSGLAGYWPLTEGTGTIAQDQSGNNNNGTWSGTQAGSSGYYNSGKVGSYAGGFNGSNDYIDLGTAAGPQSSGPLTLTSWIYFPSLPSGCTVFPAVARANGSVGNGYLLGFYGGGCGTDHFVFRLDNTWVYGVTTPSVGWNMLAGVFDGATEKLYLNGNLETSTSASSFTIPADHLNIGRGGWAAGGISYLQGSLADVRIYTRALSPAEVQALYNAEK